jgi:NAD(P)-dependent dehydrogenase (short-subunit alcohol dehydrogenase family)
MAGSTRIEVPSQHGRLAIVTGATGGLGYETALALAKAGADVIVAGRDERKGQAAIEKIRNEAPHAQASFGHLDLANLASIAVFSERALSRQSLADQQRRRDGLAAPDDHDGRLRGAIRDQLSGSFCSLGPAIAAIAPCKRTTGRQRKQPCAPKRVPRFRRSAGRAALLAVESIWTIEARLSDVRP